MLFANGAEIALVILAAIVSAIFFGGMYAGSYQIKKEAVERGYALYCADTGKFSWKDECGKGEDK